MELPLAAGSPAHLDILLWCTWVADVLYVIMICVQRWLTGKQGATYVYAKQHMSLMLMLSA